MNPSARIRVTLCSCGHRAMDHHNGDTDSRGRHGCGSWHRELFDLFEGRVDEVEMAMALCTCGMSRRAVMQRFQPGYAQ